MTSNPLVTVGIVVYQGEKYFPFLFDSLQKQTYANFEIRILDNASPTHDQDIIQKTYKKMFPADSFYVQRVSKNTGFAGGHNLLMREMQGEIYLCLNQDILLEKDFISKAVEVFQKDAKVGSVTGKLYQWDFGQKKHGKTKIIDTTGIQAFASHHFTDRGQGEDDEGQYNEEEQVFASSGAAAFYRKAALENVGYQIREQKEYFDELFFMYKEDIDLGYRLRWTGWKCIYTPHAIGYHDRSIAKKSGLFSFISERKPKPFQVRLWSWRNHQILLKKNFSPDFSLRIRWKTWWRQFWSSLYMMVFEPRVFWKVKKQLQKSVLEMKLKKVIKIIHSHQIETLFID